jgi:hypothetical protein
MLLGCKLEGVTLRKGEHLLKLNCSASYYSGGRDMLLTRFRSVLSSVTMGCGFSSFWARQLCNSLGAAVVVNEEVTTVCLKEGSTFSLRLLSRLSTESEARLSQVFRRLCL